VGQTFNGRGKTAKKGKEKEEVKESKGRKRGKKN